MATVATSTIRIGPADHGRSMTLEESSEVVSEGREAHERDYVTKRAEYLAYGLLEYWIVDLEEKIVTVLIRDGDAWVEQVYREAQKAESLVLPGLAIVLADLWPQADDDQPESQTTNGLS